MTERLTMTVTMIPTSDKDGLQLAKVLLPIVSLVLVINTRWVSRKPHLFKKKKKPLAISPTNSATLFERKSSCRPCPSHTPTTFQPTAAEPVSHTSQKS
ncbi:hypothetical protein WN943_023334 [Citrus x changshan-huyou]